MKSLANFPHGLALTGASLLFGFLLTAMNNPSTSPLSSGAPVSSTGAPAEVDCTTSGCHDDSKVNVGGATNEFEIVGAENGFEPGIEYVVRVSIADPKSQRFGFQLVALDGRGVNSGDFRITDEDATQLITNPLQLTDRRYITYTYQGTEPSSPGRRDWFVKWKAPLNVDAVTFYCATAVANNDMSDKGDEIYTSSYRLSKSSINSVDSEESRLSCYPNPCVDRLNFLLPPNEMIEGVSLVDLLGKRSIASVVGGGSQLDVEMLAPGTYSGSVRTTSGNHSIHFVKK